MEEKMDFLKELPGEEETERTGEEEGKVSDLPEISLFNTRAVDTLRRQGEKRRLRRRLFSRRL